MRWKTYRNNARSKVNIIINCYYKIFHSCVLIGALLVTKVTLCSPMDGAFLIVSTAYSVTKNSPSPPLPQYN